METVSFRIKFVNSDPDIVIDVNKKDCFDQVVKAIKDRKGWSSTKCVRLINGGKEMYATDSVSKASSGVLHCTATEGTPVGVTNARKETAPHVSMVDQPPADWLDVVDPGTVLMWIFGSILALLWLLFLFYANMFDRTSIVMLTMMTVAFLVPCVVSYTPWFSFLQTPVRAPVSSRMGGLEGVYDPVTGRSTAVASAQAVWNRHPQVGSHIPPRPQARLGPGNT